jgi:hypothetical protein
VSGDVVRRQELVGLEREDAFGVRGARWTATSLELPNDLAFSDYEHVGWVLGRLRDMTAWALGDWIEYGDAVYGQRYAQAVEATGRAKGTLMNYASVARRVPRSKRRAELSWSHHEAVAARNPVEQARWLNRAVTERLSVEELRGLVREERNLTTSVGPDLPSCDYLAEDSARDLRAALRACGYGDDLAVVITVVAPGVALEVRVP